ncbi:MAG: ABC transporter permease, partial [Armatimonadota bacterium]
MSETPMPPVVIDPGPQPRLERRGQNGLGTLLESGRIAMDMLRMHKMRSFLTMLGVIIGVMAVSMIVLLQNGLKAYIESEFSELSADTIFIIYDPSRLGRGEGRGRFTEIKEEDREYILANADKVLNVTGVVMVGGQQARFGDKEVSGVQVTGVSQDYYGAVSRDLVAGRLIEKNDVDNLANVGIISSQLADELMPGTDPLGKTVVFSGISVT